VGKRRGEKKGHIPNSAARCKRKKEREEAIHLSGEKEHAEKKNSSKEEEERVLCRSKLPRRATRL